MGMNNVSKTKNPSSPSVTSLSHQRPRLLFKSSDCRSLNIEERTPEAQVTIRFMRLGRSHEPFYRIIAVDTRKKRDTKALEFLGWYNPKTKEGNLNAPSIKKWLSLGAHPSATVAGILKRAAIIKVED